MLIFCDNFSWMAKPYMLVDSESYSRKISILVFAIHENYVQICIVLKNAQRKPKYKAKREEDHLRYDLESCWTIFLSSFAQWRRHWLSGHVVLVWVQSTVIRHS